MAKKKTKNAKPKQIVRDLRENRKQQKTQREAMLEQITIADAKIDQFDEMINTLDNKFPPLIDEINDSIDAVKKAYDDRIAADCLSPLIWQLQETKEVNSKAYAWAGGNTTFQTWKVVKDPDQRRQINRYGVKYYRFPKNREYGSNVIDEINNASIDQMTSVLVLFDSNSADYVGTAEFGDGKSIVSIGDFITDDLDDPYVFSSGNLPKVVGLGTTSYPEDKYTVSGFTTAATNIIYSDTKTGDLSTYKPGDVIFSDFFPAGTYIESIGTSEAEIYFGGDYTTPTEVSFAVVSNVALGTTENNLFTIGVLETYNALYLDTFTTVGAANSSFLIVRGPDNKDLQFESTKNPIDPVEIGIVKGKKTGKGHKVELINNGDPDVVAEWREVQQEPEPDVGAGFVEYWVGAQSWPTYRISQRGQVGGGSTAYTYTLGLAQYVPEGFTVQTAIGTTIPQGVRGTTNVSPTNPSLNGCSNLTNTISDKESEMSNTISENTPKINYYLKGTKAVRELRGEEETTAWGMLQGIAFIDDKRQKQKEHANAIDDFDWGEFGFDMETGD